MPALKRYHLPACQRLLHLKGEHFIKKLTAVLLVLAMLIPLSTAVAADEMSATPTVEEILDEYHQKLFERQMKDDIDTATTWSSRSSDLKTLEQETVDTLNEAGYEAYHVTDVNYDALEAELCTDFSKMGMDPYGSYIIVVRGGLAEDNVNDICASTYGISPEIDLEGPPNTGGLPSTYTYNGVTYSVRYITVAYPDYEDLYCENVYRLRELGYMNESWSELLNYTLTAAYDSLSQTSVASIASLIYEMTSDSNYISMDPGDMIVQASTNWTRQFIEVYFEQGNYWSVCQYSEYAKTSAYLTGTKYNESTGYNDHVMSDWFRATLYSPYYFDMDVRLSDAINVLLHSNIVSHDEMDVHFYLDSGGLAIDSNSKYLFSHDSPPRRN